MNKPKIFQIGSPELNMIKDYALRHFHSEPHLPETSSETQAFLLIRGLEDLLRQKGYEVNFSVKPVKENSGDTTPLDDLG